jgi:hypothetical protein
MAIITTRATKFLVGDTDFTGQASQATVQSAAGNSDFITFEAAAMGGNRDYTISITAGQDLAASSLWYMTFSQTGEDVECILKPYGNADTPTVDEPWVSVTATITEPDGDWIGGKADPSTTARQTFDVSWSCTRPVLITSDEDES